MSDLPVRCPACSSEYLLPEALIGEAGASVRCPTCAHEFIVDISGRISGAGPGDDKLRALARGVFDELAAKLGARLDAAAQERRLFADHGPALMEAWDEFRRRAGGRAPSQPFRDELRERFGVELFPPGD